MLAYQDWLSESHIRTSGWTEADHAEFEKLKLENLTAVCELCKAHRVRYYLDAGTLLGLYRDKKIIEADSDNDIAIFAEDITPEFLEAIAPFAKSPENASMFFQPDEFPDLQDQELFIQPKSLKYHSLSKSNRRLTFRGKEIWTDLFILFPHKDYYLFKLSGNYFRIPKKFAKGFSQLTHKGISYKIPNPVEDYLELVFGKGWETPDPHYVSSKENRGFYVISKEDHGTYKYNWATKTGKIEEPAKK